MPIQPNFLERAAIFNLNILPGVILDLGRRVGLSDSGFSGPNGAV